MDSQEALLIGHIDTSLAGTGCQMRLGDLDGDGRLNIVLVQPDNDKDERFFPHSVVSATAYTIDGEMLWQIGKPSYNTVPCCSDIPAQIFDIDRDGFNEFICVFEGEFCIFDGKTGELKRKYDLPDKDAHDCIAFADLEGVGYPQNVILKNRYHQLWAMDKNFNVMWTYKGNVGHYPVCYDINSDGKDEIIAGSVVLDFEGQLLWEIEGNDFPISLCVGDLDMSKEPSIVVSGDKTRAYNFTGEQKWELSDNIITSNLASGNVRKDCFGAEISGFFYDSMEDTDGVFVLDYHGNTLFKEKRIERTGNSDVSVIYNFDGKFEDKILVSTNAENIITVYDGYMNPEYIIKSQGQVVWADLICNNKTQIVVYDGQGVDIYSDKEMELTIPSVAQARAQTRRLYNHTMYPYGAIESERYALGYAIGQFSNPDIEAWAEDKTNDESDQTMTRADFSVVFTNIMGITGYSADTFFDVSKNDYYYPAIAELKSNGYCDEIVGKFLPMSPVTMDFVSTLLNKAAGFVPLTTKKGEEELLISDIGKIILQLIQNIKKKAE